MTLFVCAKLIHLLVRKLPETKLVLKVKEKVEFKDQNSTLMTRFVI